MRNLTIRQKKLIKNFIKGQTNPINTFEREISVFKERKDYLDVHDLPYDLFAEIEAINDSEILCNQIDSYMEELCDEIIKQ